MKKNIFLLLVVFLLLGIGQIVWAHLPRIVYTQQGDIAVQNPENSQAFYDELSGQARNYLVNSDKEFTLYINLLVPAGSNKNNRFSANVFKGDQKLAFIDGQTDFKWQEYYEEFGRDYYYKGPESEKVLPAGDYRIEVFNYENKGKYTLVIGKNEVFPILEAIKVYWILPTLKMQFFKTPVWEFLFTPFGLILIGIVGAVFIFIAFIIFVKSIIQSLKNRKPKMMLLTSSGIQDSREDIMAILPKPAEDIRVAHIITASNIEENKDYVERDNRLMKEAGFNVEEIDIEGKRYNQVLNMLDNFDIIYVQGGNTFYLLKQMRACNFKKIMKKLFRKGIIYIGVSAGSIVAGKNIQTAKWYGDKNIGIADLRGLKFVPFDIFVHYKSEHSEAIKKQSKKIKNKLKILQDGQAIFVLGKEITFVGTGEVVDVANL